MAFANFYTLSNFADAVEVYSNDKVAAADSGGSPAKKLYDESRLLFEKSIEAFLCHLRSDGLLGTTNSLSGRHIWQASAWNDFVAGKADETRFVCGILSGVFFRAVNSVERNGLLGSYKAIPDLDRTTLIERNFSALCAIVDAGNTDDFLWQITDLYDRKSGERCELHMANWQAQLMTRDGYGNAFPAGDLEAIPLVSAEFDMPSGRMLLTDALRVPGFNEAIEFEADLEYRLYDLSSDLGCARRTTGHAEQHDIGFTQTENTCVVVHRHPDTGRIIVSERWNHEERDEDADGDAAAPGWEKVGTFSCDVWRVIAVDQAKAVDLMRMGGCQPEQAEAILNSYLASNDAYAKNIVALDVPAGRWRIHSGPDFAKRVDRIKFDIPESVQPWLLLEPAS